MAYFRCFPGGVGLKQKILDTGASGMWISDLYLRQAGIPNPAADSTETKTWTSDGHYYVMWNLSAGNTNASYTVKKNNTTISTSSGRGGVEVVSGDKISIAVKSANSSTSAIRYKNINAFKVPLDA